MKKCNQVNINVKGKDENTNMPDFMKCSVRGYDITFFIENCSWLGISEQDALRLRNYLTKAIREIRKRKAKKAYL